MLLVSTFKQLAYGISSVNMCVKFNLQNLELTTSVIFCKIYHFKMGLNEL